MSGVYLDWSRCNKHGCALPCLCGCGYSGSCGKTLSSTASENVPSGYWNRDDRQANLNRNEPRIADGNCGSSSAVGVQAFDKDFNQPPVIRPISISLLCVWKIFVSFAIASSKNNRNFNSATSSRLLALIR